MDITLTIVMVVGLVIIGIASYILMQKEEESNNDNNSNFFEI